MAVRVEPGDFERRRGRCGGGLPGLALPASIEALQRAGVQDPWPRADAIVRAIRVPRFPSREFRLPGTAPSARNHVLHDAIRQAIAACRAAGGGRVVVPAGRFLTGASGSKRCRTAPDAERHAGLQPRREGLPAGGLLPMEGVELMNYSPFIRLRGGEHPDHGTGHARRSGGPDHWWDCPGTGPSAKARQTAAQTRLIEMQARGVAVSDRVFGDGQFLRPNFIQPTAVATCSSTASRSSTRRWEIIRAVSERDGPRRDRQQPRPQQRRLQSESCRDVLIERCTFDTGDDCIALKSGRNDDGRRVNVPVENRVIRDCSMKDGHGGVVIGSEISGASTTCSPSGLAWIVLVSTGPCA